MRALKTYLVLVINNLKLKIFKKSNYYMVRFSISILLLTFVSIASAQLSTSDIESVISRNINQSTVQPEDVDQLVITDNYTSREINHVYFKQSVKGIEVYNSYGAIHGNKGQYIFDQSRLFRGIDRYNVDRAKPSSLDKILSSVANQKSYKYTSDLTIEKSEPLVNMKQVALAPSVSQSPIQTRLVYYKTGKNKLELGRIVTIDDVNSPDYIEFLVHAETGDIIEEYNYTVYCDWGDDHENHNHGEFNSGHDHHEHAHAKSNSILAPNQYRVYEQPKASPYDGGQTDVTAPWLLNPTASPNGWHNYNNANFTHTRGNNVDSYLDDDNTNSPTNGNDARADGGANLEFLYDVDITGDPVNNQEGAIVNLFYWCNIIHDVWFNYGFDEPSGNFQEENYTSSGASSDYVQAEAQDGSGTCNANMSTPADGSNPRIQMYLCSGNDGDLDNLVVVHEYAHGISIRLTGGPSNSGCLNNQEQMGEGWSDYYGLMMTIQPSDVGTTSRPVGNYLFAQGPNGAGIRSYPYTTDTNVNPFTYDDIKTESVPHGVGSVWATMLWDMTWALIDEYGFDPDLYNGTGGNNIAMHIVTEGLKLQPCNPGFVDGRDAILAADQALYGGANQCLIWQAFADRGLGASASQGSTGDRSDGVEAFDMPGICVVELEKTSDVTEALPGEEIVYSITATNNTAVTQTSLEISDPLPANTLFVSATDGGTVTNGVVNFPAFDLVTNSSKTVSFTVQIDPTVVPDIPDFIDDMENGSALWNTSNTGNSSWGLTNASASSGTMSWFASDVGNPSIANLVTATTLQISNTTELTFSHSYDTEATWDGGVVEISQDNGATWTDLGNDFTANGYNSTINNSRPAFSGNSNGFINSTVDLSSYVGPALIRFQMNCDQSVAGLGWYIDDVLINNQQLAITNTAEIDVDGVTYTATVDQPTLVLIDPNALVIQTDNIDILCDGDTNGKAWVTASNGSGSYTYSWSTGATTDTIFNLSAGTYIVTVDDGISIKASSVTVESPAALGLSMSATDAPSGTGGTATATVTGGTSPYIYDWSNGGVTSTIDNLVPGNYAVTVTDDNGCTISDNIDVVDPTNCSDNNIVVEIMMDEWPEDITVIVRDENGNTVYENAYDNSTPDGAIVFDYICVADACYEIEIDDAYGDGLCQNGSIVGSYKITDGATNQVLFEGCDIGNGVIHDICYPLLSLSYTHTDPSCTGLSDGSIDLTVNGGSPNPTYTYSNGETTQDISGIPAGIYTVVVNDGVTEVTETIEVYQSKASVYVNAGNDDGSLYYAATNACISDTINFEDVLMNDVVVVDQEVPLQDGHVVNGLGIQMITVSGNNTNRIFNTAPGSTVEIINMTLMDTNESTNGGAIYNNGTLILEDVLFKNNFEGALIKSLTNRGTLIVKGNVTMEE